MEQIGFGGIGRVKDTRDFSLGAVQPFQPIPSVYLPDISTLPTHHQHKLPTCGANSFVWFQEYKFGGHFTPRYTWRMVKNIDGYALEDGTDMRSIFKSGQSEGVCDDALLPDDSTLDVTTYSSPTITQGMKDNAQPKIVQSYAFIDAPFSMNEIKQAIYQNKVVLALVDVGDEWYTSVSGVTTWNEADILPLRSPKKVVSGHFIVLYGYDEKYCYFKNSWGPTWGRGGTGYFDESYLPFVREIGTAIDEDPTTIKALMQKKNLLTTIVSLWTQLKKLTK
jgi:hypothetical protein